MRIAVIDKDEQVMLGSREEEGRSCLIYYFIFIVISKRS